MFTIEHVGGPGLLGLSLAQYVALLLGVALFGWLAGSWFRRK